MTMKVLRGLSFLIVVHLATAAGMAMGDEARPIELALMGKQGMKGKAGGSGSMASKSFARGCHAVCSPFGSRTRCDGSRRSPKFPVHGGIDMAIPQGTPLVAVADGTVVGSGRGASIGGIGLVLQHPPEATGLAGYTYSVYKHLMAPSPLAIGASVHKGQVVGASGKTGTQDGYYGADGFEHLHFEVFTGGSAKWPSGRQSDPVTFLGGRGWPCK